MLQAHAHVRFLLPSFFLENRAVVFLSFSVLKTNRNIGGGNRINLIDAVYDTSEFESASVSSKNPRSKGTRYPAINVRIRAYGSVRGFSVHGGCTCKDVVA